jgi:hypothetical protein
LSRSSRAESTEVRSREPFRDPTDPDDKRREIVWIAISFIVILATWLAVVLVFGCQPLMLGMSYDEAVLLSGLGLLVFCSVLYLGAREREQRTANRRLLGLLRQGATRLDQRVEQLRDLCSASAQLTGSLDPDEISRAALAAVAEALDASGASLVLIDARTGQPVHTHHAPGGGAFEDTSPLLLQDDTSSLFANPDSGEASTPLGLAPPRPEWRGGRDLQAYIELWSSLPNVICAPLRLNNGLVGVLGARRGRRQNHFTPHDIWLLTTLANMAANAIESALLHAELRDSYFSTVRSLVNSLHARDNYTATHGRRVTELAVRIGEQMALPDAVIRDLELFGPLHDVGKIGIRDAILLKPMPLSLEEQADCREHCIIGERIIRPLKPSQDALAMVRNHHESWDGRGYPDGLAGEAIPLLARLLHVADSYDAMTSQRPYQPAMSQQEVLAHFRQFSGKRYDPTIVDALLALIQEDTRAEAPWRKSAAPTVRPLRSPAEPVAALPRQQTALSGRAM